MIVSERAGTTREAVDIGFKRGGSDYILVDTAGIRRRARTKEHLEKIGVLSSLKALRRSEIAVLVVDASEDIAEQDARIAGYLLQHRCGAIVALNKWDRVAKNKLKRQALERGMEQKLRFLEFAPVVRVSATHGTGIDMLFKEIDRVHANYVKRVQTADLNRVIQMSVLRQSPPSKGHRPTKVFYGSQVSSGPPTFRLFTNHPEEIRDSYTRYMENQFRYHFGLKGTPIQIHWQGRRDGESGGGRVRRR